MCFISLFEYRFEYILAEHMSLVIYFPFVAVTMTAFLN